MKTTLYLMILPFVGVLAYIPSGKVLPYNFFWTIIYIMIPGRFTDQYNPSWMAEPFKKQRGRRLLFGFE